jgi:hypothetical protein
MASGPANFIIAIADFTTPANPTVTTFNPPALPCLDADENVKRIVTGDTTAGWVRLYDTSLNWIATANTSVSPMSLNLGSAYAPCQTTQASVTIQNSGGISLAVTSISTTGPRSRRKAQALSSRPEPALPLR